MIGFHQQTFTPEFVGDQQGAVRFKQYISLPTFSETFKSVFKTFDQPVNEHTFHQPDALTTGGVIPSHSIFKLKQTFLLYTEEEIRVVFPP